MQCLLERLAKLEIQSNIEPLMKEEHFKAREDLIMAILSDPCFARFGYKRRPYLLTDFSKTIFGNNLCQPANDAAFLWLPYDVKWKMETVNF